MSFNYLQLKNIKKLVNTSKSSLPENPERRKFIKTMGFGVIAANPIVKTVGALNGNSFDVIHKNQYFAIVRNGDIVWEINKRFFGDNYLLKINQKEDRIEISAKNLQIIQTNFTFDLQAVISKDLLEKWRLDFTIPQYDISEKVDFIEWLDGYKQIQSKITLNQNLLNLNSEDFIHLKGNFSCEISNDWNFSLQNKNGISAHFNNNKYISDYLELSPKQDEFSNLLKNDLKNSAHISIHSGKDWQHLISNINGENEFQIDVSKDDEPSINLSLGTTVKGEKIRSLWISKNEGNLIYHDNLNTENKLEFSNYFYLLDYSNTTKPEFFFTAKMKESEQWISNGIGVFHLGTDDNNTELEIYGKGNKVLEHRLLPKFKSFTPNITGGIALPITLQNTSLQLKASPFFDKKNTKLKKSTKNQPTLKQDEKTVEYTPKKPIKIKVLRPEDMVHLEFEFHNFKFVGDKGLYIKPPINITKPVLIKDKTKINKVQPINNGTKPIIKSNQNVKKVSPSLNKGLISNKTLPTATIKKPNAAKQIVQFDNSYYAGLRLDNPNKKGIVVIYFPSQHTLEQAYTEGSSVNLPAKHLRAKKSRLVYELPAGHKGFDLTMKELLDWSKFKLVVDPRAYIKLNTVATIKPTYKTPNISVKTPANAVYLNKELKDYGVKMVEANKSIAEKGKIYEEKQLNKVLFASDVKTLKPQFNLVKEFKYVPVMGPISKLHTSIEAPALLYISPNQINDFYHKTVLEKEVTSNSTVVKVKDKGKVGKVRLNHDIQKYSLKPLTSKYNFFRTSKGEISELWHTQLGVKMKDGKTSLALDRLKTIRALWAEEAGKDLQNRPPAGDVPFKASLNARQRHTLVHETSNFGISNYKPQPVKVKKLILSNLGAYIDWHAHFKTPSGNGYLDIIEWQHQATLGRDNFVKIVEEGFLFPFGHKAVKVTITERKFDTVTKAAVNKQRKFIVVLQESVTYQRNDINGNFIKFPFQEIIIRDKQTPDNLPEEKLSNDNSFIIKNFKFTITGIDKEGQQHLVKMPLAFVSKSDGLSQSSITSVISKYHKEQFNKYTDIPLNGQQIAYSESILDGDTTLETESLHFGAMVYPTKVNSDIKFHPIMRESKVYIEAVDKMTGARKPARIQLEDDKNQASIFASVVDAVVDFSNNTQTSGGFISPNMAINSLSKIEGAITSKIEDLADNALQVVSLLDPLADLPLPKLFGAIKIASLIADRLVSSELADFLRFVNVYTVKVIKIQNKIRELKDKIMYLENEALEAVHEVRQNIEDEITNAVDDVNAEIERRINEVKAEINAQIEDVQAELKTQIDELITTVKDRMPVVPNLKTYYTDEAFYAEYKWKPKFKDKEIKVIEGLLSFHCTNPKDTLSITTLVEKPFTLDATANISTVAKMNNFSIDLEPILKVNFDSMKFTSGNNVKTDVKVAMSSIDPATHAPISPIEFKGALTFVNSLQDLIPSGGFGDDGPYINLLPSGVKAGFNLSIPDVEIGVCSITNMSLGAYVMLPFSSAPLTMGFNFCTRENPFMLTISGFGGGGFFMMITTLDGIQTIEAAFEFGASMSLNLGVASGGVTVMGGFYFNMTTEVVQGEDVSTVVLSGYLRMNGKLSVLGMIHVSVEFYLALDAVIVRGKVEKMVGTATLKVKVEVLFFSKTVSMTVQRELHGADADPKFIEMVDADDWQQYCLAFAG